MTYREIAPPGDLRAWVECFWTRDGNPAAGPVRVLPDGAADLVFDLRRGEGMVVGTMTRALVIPGEATGSFAGVRFRPGCAASFLRVPLAEITDARVPIASLWRGWSDGVIDGGASELLTRITPELLRRFSGVPDPRLLAAAARLESSGGTLAVDAVASEVGLTRQHLARKFLQYVGLTPKQFARVARFRRLLAAVRSRQQVDWAAEAVSHGYYDQSHLIAEFRALAGVTPNAFHFSNR